MVGISTPLHDYSLPTPPKSEPHPLPAGMADIDAMIAECGNDEQKLLIVLCGMVGLRVSEALDIKPSHFNFGQLELTVTGKGEKTRTVPISEEAWEQVGTYVTEAFLRGRTNLIHYSDRGARKLITAIGARANVARPVASHDLRATYATELHNAGVPIRVVQELLGHAHVSTTEGYTGVNRAQMRQAVNWRKK